MHNIFVQLSPRWLLSFDSEDVAQQLTLIEQSYYMQIEPVYVMYIDHMTTVCYVYINEQGVDHQRLV